MRTLTLSILLSVATCAPSFARESRNCPKEEEATEAVLSADNSPGNMTQIKELASHKTANSYVHIFSGVLNKKSYLFIFNNQKQYLGYYHFANGRIGGYTSRHRCMGVITPTEEVVIRLGNRGPWKNMEGMYTISKINSSVPSDSFVFNATQHYVAPTIKTELRTWTYGKEKKTFSAKLVDADGEVVFLQNADSDVVYYIFDDNLTNEDRKYIKSVDFGD